MNKKCRRKKFKHKTRTAIAKRFKITKTGKVLRLSSFARHLKRSKSRKQLRRLSRPVVVTGVMARKIKKLLGA